MSDFNPDKIYQTLVTRGTAWAEANAAADLLEETRKSVLAELMTECNERSQSAKETYALRHKTYLEHIANMNKARKAANIARVNYESAKTLADMKRTEAANLRATERYAT